MKKLNIVIIVVVIVSAFKLIGPINNLHLYYSSPIIEGQRVPKHWVDIPKEEQKEQFKMMDRYLRIYNSKRYLILEYLGLFISIVSITSCIGIFYRKNVYRVIQIFICLAIIFIQQPLTWLFITTVSGLNPLNIMALMAGTIFNCAYGGFLIKYFMHADVKKVFTTNS